MMDSYGGRVTTLLPRNADLGGLFRSLAKKFSTNFECALADQKALPIFEIVERKARVFPEVGRVLAEVASTSETQREILVLSHEIFSDIVCSAMLGAFAFDPAAQMVLRRALELGIAAVYLFDLPHRFWGWKAHDLDLSYRDMVDHLSSASYTTFISKLGGAADSPPSFDEASANALYRELSNIVHPKVATFESVLQDRFAYNQEDWLRRLEQMNQVEDLLLAIWTARFAPIDAGLSAFLKSQR